MNAVRIYDVLTQARHKLFDWMRPLCQEQYTREFPFGRRTLRATMIELARVELYLSMRLREERLPAWEDWPITEERLPMFSDLETAWTAQAPKTRGTLAAITDWSRSVTARVTLPDKHLVLTATKADIATQLLLHEVHHRAQAMAMLRQLGLGAQDLDYIGFVQKREEQVP
jgi:uncharacterized damage-inducible protein DinB